MEKRSKPEPKEPQIVHSKMSGSRVIESEIKGIEDLTPMERKHLLLQLARDRVENNSAGPWEIVHIIREQWRAVKATLAQPIEIEIRDAGKDSLFKVSMDITRLERELEAGRKKENLSSKTL